MSNYHSIIQQERRTPVVTEMGEDRSRLAILITSTFPTEQPDTYVAGETMLHSYTAADMSRTVGEGADAQKLPPDFSAPQFVMVAEWDGVSPYAIQHKGDYAARNLSFAGWPEITKDSWDSQTKEETP